MLPKLFEIKRTTEEIREISFVLSSYEEVAALDKYEVPKIFFISERMASGQNTQGFETNALKSSSIHSFVYNPKDNQSNERD